LPTAAATAARAPRARRHGQWPQHTLPQPHGGTGKQQALCIRAHGQCHCRAGGLPAATYSMRRRTNGGLGVSASTILAALRSRSSTLALRRSPAPRPGAGLRHSGTPASGDRKRSDAT